MFGLERLCPSFPRPVTAFASQHLINRPMVPEEFSSLELARLLGLLEFPDDLAANGQRAWVVKWTPHL